MNWFNLHVRVLFLVCVLVPFFVSCSSQDASNVRESLQESVVNLNELTPAHSMTVEARRFGQYYIPIHGPYPFEPNGITFILEAKPTSSDIPKFWLSINLSERSEHKPSLESVADRNFENDSVDVTVYPNDEKVSCQVDSGAIVVNSADATCKIDKKTALITIKGSDWNIPSRCSDGCNTTNEKIGHLSGTLKFDVQYTNDKDGKKTTREFKYEGPFDVDLMNCVDPCLCTGSNGC